jgi:hypothetical protein
VIVTAGAVASGAAIVHANDCDAVNTPSLTVATAIDSA